VNSDRIGRILVCGIVCLLATRAYGQTTWYVDDDALNDLGPGDPTVSDPGEDGTAAHPFDAIEEGIDAATADDTVLVLDGTYTGAGNKNLDFAGKAISVRSEHGPRDSIIDCQDSGRGFFFGSGESATSVVEGFTIRNGRVLWGGGPGGGDGGAIYCDGSSPRIVSCEMWQNWAEQDGGAVFCNLSACPTLVECTIVDNEAMGYGGGICCYNEANATIEKCTVDGNTAVAGSGIAAFNCSPTLTECRVVNNASAGGT